MIVDTTFLIDVARGSIDLKKYKNTTLKTTQINAFEILVGAHRTNSVEKIVHLLTSFEVLNLTNEGIQESAIISAKALEIGKAIGQSDCLIAGIAKAHGENTIITRNIKHFKYTGLKVISH